LVIFLEENRNIKDELYFKLRLPDGQEIRFSVPVLKYWKYSAEDLKDKKLYALLPLQVFKSRKRIKSIYNNEYIKYEDKGKLINTEFKKLIEIIQSTINVLGELYNSYEIIGTDLEKILRVLRNITEYLYNKYGEYSSVGKEVDIMVTTLYNPIIAEEAKREGVAKTAIRLLTKKFGVLAEDMRIKIEQLDAETLDIIVDEMLDYDSLEDVYKHLK
jgi:hypothetical protein